MDFGSQTSGTQIGAKIAFLFLMQTWHILALFFKSWNVIITVWCFIPELKWLYFVEAAQNEGKIQQFEGALSASWAASNSLRTPYLLSSGSTFFKWLSVRLSERISSPAFEPGRTVSKRVLIDFQVVAVGNASHR